MAKMTKNSTICDLETKINDKIQVISTQHTKISEKESKTILNTFPFPYMNGMLHLGHLYTISKCEFNTRFMKLKGHKVLFPFAFHGTGMPIAACAQRLEQELVTTTSFVDNTNQHKVGKQTKIMLDMDIPLEDLPKFIDPNYWIEYFSRETIVDLKRLGMYIDWSRSFHTTSTHFYFDLFVKWQFKKLHKKGYLIEDVGPVIYSVKDGQPCSDHDRSTGEGVGIGHYDAYLVSINEEYQLVVTQKHGEQPPRDNIDFIIVQRTDLVTFKLDNGDKRCIGSNTFVLNYSNQGHIISDIHPYCELIDKEKIEVRTNIPVKRTNSAVVGSGSIFRLRCGDNVTSTLPDLGISLIGSYYEPESKVVSRSGDICVVSLLKQWYIDYGQQELKNQVNNYIESELFCYNPESKEAFLVTSRWLNKWPCSRSFGLGTQLLDTRYVIDSLSDSTIYTAFYTISHIIDKLQLNENIIMNTPDLIDNIFDYVFDIIPNDSQPQALILLGAVGIDTTIVEQMQREFKSTYPVDLRVSGKDLAGNHLVMALHNHVMIWGNTRDMPKAYFINGHLLLNGEKMSKNTGNFMTIRQGLEKYSADVLRLTIAETGTATNDANYVTVHANAHTLQLYNELEWIDNNYQLFKPNVYPHNLTFKIEVVKIMKQIENFMENLDYQKAVSNGINELLKCRDKHRKRGATNFDYFIVNFLIALEPFCPHFVQHLWTENNIKKRMWPTFESKPQSLTVSFKVLLFEDILCNILDRTKKFLKKRMQVQVFVYLYFNDVEQNDLKSFVINNSFTAYVSKQRQIYSKEWDHFVISTELFTYLEQGIALYEDTSKGIQLARLDTEQQHQQLFQENSIYGPGRPLIKPVHRTV